MQLHEPLLVGNDADDDLHDTRLWAREKTTQRSTSIVVDVESNSTTEKVKETLRLIALGSYDRVNGQHSVMNRLGLTLKTSSKVVRTKTFTYVFMALFVLAPLAIIYAISSTLAAEPLYCTSEEACPTIPKLQSDEAICRVRKAMQPVYTEVTEGAEVNCWYYSTQKFTLSSDCDDLCPSFHNGLLLDCGSIDRANSSGALDPDAIKTMVGCFYGCTDQTCLSKILPSSQSCQEFLTIFFLEFVIFTLIIQAKQSKYFPLQPRPLVRKLTSGFRVGTFMVSYSWGAAPGEQGSSAIVADLARMLPCCWWDREQLLPGADVRQVCIEAAENCIHAFVFISHNYMRSPICQTELNTLRQVRGKVIGLMHSDVFETDDGKRLREDLLKEGHTVDILYPSTQVGNNISMIITRRLKGWKNHWLSVFYPDAFTTSVDNEIFGVTEELFPYDKFIWMVLCGRGVFRTLFKIQSPEMNEDWRCTASVLNKSMRWWKYSRMILAMSAYFIANPVIVFIVWGFKFGSFAWHITYGMFTLVGWVFLVLFVSELHVPYAKDHIPQSAHLLMILHRLGVFLPSHVEEIIDSDHNEDLDMESRPQFRVIKSVWPFRDALVPPPIQVDLGPKIKHGTKQKLSADIIRETKILKWLHRKGIINVHFGGVNLNDVELQYVQIFPECEIMEADPERQVFWTKCGFMELSQTTRQTLSNCVVAVECADICAEQVIIQIVLRKFGLSSKALRVGSGKWKNKALRKYLRN